MTHTELKQVILDYILELYKCMFIGDIKIEDLDPEGYKVSFYLDRSENPVVIISDLPDEQFLPFIKEELRARKFQKVKHYLAYKTPPESICNERKRIYRQNQ